MCHLKMKLLLYLMQYSCSYQKEEFTVSVSDQWLLLLCWIDQQYDLHIETISIATWCMYNQLQWNTKFKCKSIS